MYHLLASLVFLTMSAPTPVFPSMSYLFIALLVLYSFTDDGSNRVETSSKTGIVLGIVS